MEEVPILNTRYGIIFLAYVTMVFSKRDSLSQHEEITSVLPTHPESEQVVPLES